jgi:thioredoxin-like negative regulator of GroEL
MRVEDVPSWGGHWNQGVLLSHTATAWLDLGEVRRAADALDALEQQNEDQPRRRLYYGLQRSRLGLLDHDIEAAAHHANRAVEALPGIRSHRSWRQVEIQITTLSAAADRHPRIIELHDRWEQVKPSSPRDRHQLACPA